MRPIATALLSASLLVAATGDAVSQFSPELKRALADCDSTSNWQVRIAGCTRALNARSWPANVQSVLLHQRGQGYNFNRQPRNALADFDAALKLNPNSAALHGDRAKSHIDLEDNERALADVQQALKLDPKNLVALVNRASILNVRGQTEASIADSERVLAIDPRISVAYTNLGVSYSMLGEYDRAIANFDQAIRLNTTDETSYGNRAIAWIAKGDFDRAIADYDKVMVINPKVAAGLIGRCYSRFLANDLDAAMADCDQSLKLAPDHTSAFFVRGGIWSKKGNIDKALADYDKSIALDPRNAVAFAARGEIWRVKKDFGRAVSDFTEAIRLSPKIAATPVYRGLTREALGDIAGARADFNAALKLPSTSFILGNRGNYFQTSVREKETAKARLAVLSEPAAASGKPDAPSSAPATPADSGKRIALVIGNGNYVNTSSLANPANDARSISKALRGMGYEVSEGIDLDQAAMKALIGDFLRKAATARLALMFYAGHGIQIDGKNFLLPVDAQVENPAALIGSVTDLDTILAGLDDRIRTNIVILDACRDNPIAPKVQQAANAASRNVSVRSGLAAPSGLSAGSTFGAGTLLAFATAPGQVALDGEAENSPFSTALARHINTPGLEVQVMLTRVRAEVVAATKNLQVPWSNSSLLGEVYLVGKP